VGTLLSVELKSPDAAVTLEARVFSVRASPEGADRPAGMAVRFLDLPAPAFAKLQSILDHHRPPARTRLGVGDDTDALLASAGGREGAPETDAGSDEAVALSASVQVEGRAPSERRLAAGATPPPRHEAPRALPVHTPSAAPAHFAPPESSGQLPSISPREIPRSPRRVSRAAIVAIVIGTIAAFVAVAILLARASG
jgi:hypothetical protein